MTPGHKITFTPQLRHSNDTFSASIQGYCKALVREIFIGSLMGLERVYRETFRTFILHTRFDRDFVSVGFCYIQWQDGDRCLIVWYLVEVL